MAKDTCCNCMHITTGAVLMGVLQSVIVVMLLSTSGVLLERWHFWKSEFDLTYPIQLSTTTTSTSTTTSATTSTLSGTPPTTTTSLSIIWAENESWWRQSGLMAFLVIHLVHHIAFYSLWLVFLVMYALAFKTYRPALVLPNMIMQVIAVALMMILAGVIIAKLVLLSREYELVKSAGNNSEKEDTTIRYAFYSILLGCLVVGWVCELIFIWIGIDFYHYLRDNQHTVYPTLNADNFQQQQLTIRNRSRQETQQAASSIEAGPKLYREDGAMA